MNHCLINYQLTALKKALSEGRYKNRYALEGKIRKLEDKAKMEVKKAALWEYLAR